MMGKRCNGVHHNGHQCQSTKTKKVTVRGGLGVSLCQYHLALAELEA